LIFHDNFCYLETSWIIMHLESSDKILRNIFVILNFPLFCSIKYLFDFSLKNLPIYFQGPGASINRVSKKQEIKLKNKWVLFC
jgi:hypothetical protein